uniref:Ig-like domain-containing protein n=1 Tax=Coturnix japonica TaxID=93934 RepID=A0A8C2TWJ9_COTJA
MSWNRNRILLLLAPSSHPSSTPSPPPSPYQSPSFLTFPQLLPPSSTPAQMCFISGCNHPSFSHPRRTLLAHLMALHLLQLGSALLTVVAPNHHVTATVGQDIVLHCQLSPSKDAWSSDIRWFQHGSAGFVHHYRNGEDLEQMEEYKGRTELLRDGLSDGNLGLLITAVSSVDRGSYICAVEDSDGYADAVVELEVSDPFSQIVHPWKVALAVVIILLVGSSVLIIFFLHRKQVAQNRVLKGKNAALAEQAEKLERKDASLAEQAKRMERTDELLVKLPSILKRSDAKLDTLAGKLVEITEKFDIWNSQLKLRAFQLKNLVAELEKTDTVLAEIRAVKIVERTEALGESSSSNPKNMAFPMG